MSRLLAPAEVDDAIAYGFAKLAHTPSAQLQAEAEAHRARKGLPPSQLPAELDALLYGIAKLINGTPLGQLRDEANAYRSTSIGAVPARDQLAHLDQIVWTHEDYWSSLAQHNPRSTALREFFKRHWDPWYGNWMLSRPRLDLASVSEDARANFVQEAAKGLTALRELAAYNLIPTPDLGTTQHGFSREEEPLVASARSRSKVSGPTGIAYNAHYLGESTMSIEHFRATAIQAVTGTQQHNPSPVYGYFRQGVQQKIYLFPNEQDAHAWFDQRGHTEPGYDYIAVFSAANLHAPVVEDLGASVPHPANVGHWALPLAFGGGLGAFGGYHLHKWQQEHPGKTFPWISGDLVGGEPWQSIVGAQAHLHAHGEAARQRPWLTTKALIQSAIDEVVEAASMAPAAAYVWSLDPPGPSSHPGVELTAQTLILPFSSYGEALDYVRSRHGTPFVATAIFDQANRWPNPVNWSKSHAPEHEPLIAQQIAKHASTRMAGDFVGGEPWQSIIGGEPWHSIVGGEPWHSIIGADPAGQALSVLRRQAIAAAEEMPGRAVGVRRGADGKWRLKSFRSADDADDWFGHAIAEPSEFTYAAYFSKDRHGIPFLENEQIGRASRARREIASATVAP